MSYQPSATYITNVRNCHNSRWFVQIGLVLGDNHRLLILFRLTLKTFRPVSSAALNLEAPERTEAAVSLALRFVALVMLAHCDWELEIGPRASAVRA